MLVTFSVSNFMSIRDKATLSLVKGTGNEMAKSNAFDPQAPATPPLLASAAIYGANAAGKTNLIRALRTMREIVLNSFKESNVGDELKLVPFLLDEKSGFDPTEFEMVFVAQNVQYRYGFSATREHILDEWLLAYPKGKPQRLIDRTFNSEKGRYDWGSTDKLSGQKQVWQEATRPNALFLSTAVQFNSDRLRPVFDWFSRTLQVVSTKGWDSQIYTATQCEEPDFRSRIEHFLRVADLDIEGIDVKREAITPDSIPKALPDFLRSAFLENLAGSSRINVSTVHSKESGEKISFDLSAESDGTQKFFKMAGPWLDTLENGYVLVVDELNEKLHPLLVRFLIEQFHDKRVNRKNAQLVLTTHYTSMLTQELFRRDQIWFIEKDRKKSSVLYPLTDFSPRKGVENIERGYLTGRYGALPSIQELAGALAE